MEKAYFKAFVIIFWLASMTWLLVTKMLPLPVEERDRDAQYFASPQADSTSGRWLISSRGKDVGWTEMRAQRVANGSLEIHSEMQLENLDLKNFAQELFQGWSALLNYVRFPRTDAAFSLRATTEILLGADGALERWDMEVGLVSALERIRIVGNRHGEQMRVHIAMIQQTSPSARSTEDTLFETTIGLPREALTVDSFSPRPRLANLRVGDRWRFQSFQAFPPSAAPHVVEATVERTELLVWDSDIQSTFVVSFRDISGNRPTVSEGAYSTLWVLRDGTVVKQNSRFATLELGFERLPSRATAAETR